MKKINFNSHEDLINTTITLVKNKALSEAQKDRVTEACAAVLQGTLQEDEGWSKVIEVTDEVANTLPLFLK